MAQLVKNLLDMRETWVQSLGWEDRLEKGKATQSSILASRILSIVRSMGSQRVGHNQSHHFITNRWENNGNSDRLILGAPKSLQMVTAAMKLKDAYSLEGKLWPT